jgi:SAM-dependent methyltransferase
MGYSSSASSAIETSVGHKMSAAAWIDAHYEACAFEYETMLRSAGLQRGWRVLDAGCGTGGFLPLIAELVGEHGKVAAIDVAPEHVEGVRRKADAGSFACPVTAQAASIMSLPFPENTFDAVWSANVFQYLGASDRSAALGEFLRVLKPAGLLAIKDGDLTGLQIAPVPPLVLWRLLDAWARSGDRQATGMIESIKIDSHVRDRGFMHVSRHVTFIERVAPLRISEMQFIAGLIAFFGKLADTLDHLRRDDVEYWRRIADAASPEYILRQPDLYLREAAVLVLGYKGA